MSNQKTDTDTGAQPLAVPPPPTGSAPRWMQRGPDADKIRDAYEEAEKALGKVGYLLRTTEAGAYMWSGRHKTAISGMRATLNILRFDVPRYDDKPNVKVMREDASPQKTNE